MAELERRYKPTQSRGDYIAAFRLPDGRELGIQRTAKVVIWMEGNVVQGPPPISDFDRYDARQGRNTNLPNRLNHQPSGDIARLGFPCPVFKLNITSADELTNALGWYDANSGRISRGALEALRKLFLERCPDFRSFAQTSGTYFEHERAYKSGLIEEAAGILNGGENTDPTEIGRSMLRLIQRPPANFVGWRAFAHLQRAGPDAEADIATELGELLLSGKTDPDSVAATASRIYPKLKLGTAGASASAQVRSLVTVPLALVRPASAIAIKTNYLEKAAKSLLGRTIFKSQVLTAEEYRTLIEVFSEMFRIMENEWEWKPQDLWDVQGFLWITNDDSWANVAQADKEQDVMNDQVQFPTTNLILFGPPGTGKTFATAEEAIRICDGGLPDGGGRDAVMTRYRQLQREGRVHFVTFHQSYSYEDFVEGLRPDIGSEEAGGIANSGGFRLRPTDGIFKRIVALAGKSSHTIKSSGSADVLDRNDRKFFKMSLGNWSDSEVYDDAIEGDYIALGWGGDIDWSDERFSSVAAIKAEWSKHGQAYTAKQGNVDQTNRFRNTLRNGDIVIVPEGSKNFKAIGEVVGPYEFVGDADPFKHRRRVRWLKVFNAPLSRDLIFDRDFRPKSIYEMSRSGVRLEALQGLIGRETSEESEKPYVLVIDEINRANVSKVFGELITLLEPDKRIGMQNEIRLTLPYSGDEFGVPKNLHIVATMNTADRSIALLDTALRRRFDFKPVMPRYDVELLPTVDGVDMAAVLRAINERVEYLYDRDHQIGHAYFIGCCDRAQIDSVMRDKVVPLLMEYFHEDWDKVRQVLNESENEGSFVSRTKLRAPKNGSSADFDADRYRYTVNDVFADNAYQTLIA
jgi:hypothetical protein